MNVKKKQTGEQSVSEGTAKLPVPADTSSQNLPLTLIEERDERFSYWKGKQYPRCTFVLDVGWPKDSFFSEWLKKNGTDADRIRDEAGERGTRVHEAIHLITKGEGVFAANYSREEKRMITAFLHWHAAVKPELILAEQQVFHKKLKVVGTFDALYKINGIYVLVDYKTSASYNEKFQFQTSFYAAGYKSCTKNALPVSATAVLRLGTSHKTLGLKGKKQHGPNWEWTERDSNDMKQDFDSYSHCKKTFDKILGDIKPNNEVFPSVFKL